MKTWDRIREHLAQSVSAESYRNWLAPTEQLEEGGGRLIVRVPSDATKQWMEQEYGGRVTDAIRLLSLAVTNVSYEVAPIGGGNSGPLTATVPAGQSEFTFPVPSEVSGGPLNALLEWQSNGMLRSVGGVVSVTPPPAESLPEVTILDQEGQQYDPQCEARRFHSCRDEDGKTNTA